MGHIVGTFLDNFCFCFCCLRGVDERVLPVSREMLAFNGPGEGKGHDGNKD